MGVTDQITTIIIALKSFFWPYFRNVCVIRCFFLSSSTCPQARLGKLLRPYMKIQSLRNTLKNFHEV